MDGVQRKLATLDHVSPWQALGGFAIQSCPLLLPSLGLMLGILIQHGLDPSPPALGSALLGIVLLFVVVLTRIPKARLSFYLAGLAGLSFACLGALRLVSYQRVLPQDMRTLVQDRPRMVTLRGTVDSDPLIEQSNWIFASLYHLEPATTFDLKTDALLTAQGWQPVRARVRVRVAEPVIDLRPLQRIELYGWLDRFGPPSNPGQFDLGKHLARQQIHLWVSTKSRLGLIRLAPIQAHYLRKLRFGFQHRVSQALMAGLPADPGGRGLLQALILGQRRDIEADTYMAFRKTGLLHFISLSGLHMGILAALVWWICRTAGLLKRGRAAVCLCIITLFALVVPARAPTLRAAIICWIFCLSFFFQRRPHPLNTLCLAALILLLARPTQLFDAGWQLSFASVLGILVLARPLFDQVMVAVARVDWTGVLTDLAHPLCRGVGRAMLSLLCVGLGAWLGGAGILLWHFYRVTPAACVWTVLVFPLVAVILVLGFLKIVLCCCLPWTGTGLGGLLCAGAKWLIRVVKGIDGLGPTSVLVGHAALGWILVYYVALFLMRFAPIRRIRTRWIMRSCLVLLLLVGIGIQRHQNQHRSDLLLTCLDVGHGQALVLQLPARQNLLFDAGSLYTRDIGRRVVIPFLEYQGIDRLDQVILSHNDADHLNGIPEVVSFCKTDHLSVPIAFFCGDQAGPGLATLRQWLSESGLDLETLDTDIPTQSEAQIRVLWPTEACRGQALTDNDRSLVVLIEFAQRAILICADIEQTAQRQVLALYPNLDVDVLIAPHHGSVTTLAPEFLAGLRPEIVVCSCSASQWRKGRVIRPQAPYEIWYTARHGAVAVRVYDTGELRISPTLEPKDP